MVRQRSFGQLIVITLATTSLLALSNSASAGGLTVARFGGVQGHPTTDNLTAAYYNPAGIALDTGFRFYIEGTLALRMLSYDRPEGAISNVLDPDESGVGTPQEAIAANSGEAELTNFLVSPFASVAYGQDNWGVALSFFAPTGGSASWDQNEAFRDNEQFPGAVDGVNRWFSIDGQIRSIYLSASAAYRFELGETTGLSIGVSPSLVTNEVYTIRAREVMGTDNVTNSDGDPGTLDDTVVEGRSLLDVSNRTFALGAGAILDFQDQSDGYYRIGFSWQSAPGFGETTLDGELSQRFGAQDTVVTQAGIEQELADVFRLGLLVRRGEQLEFRVNLDYQRWGRFENQCIVSREPGVNSNCEIGESGETLEGSEGVIVNIPRQWNSTFGVGGSVSYFPVPGFEFNAGTTFDSASVPDESIDPSIIDQNKLISVLGARFGSLLPNTILSATLLNVFYFDRTVDPADTIEFMPPSGVPDGAGTYQQSVWALLLGVQFNLPQ